MNRLENIKERVKSEEYIVFIHSDTLPGEDHTAQEDVIYLLSKLEIAQKALEKVDMNLMAIDEKDNLGMRVKSDTFNLIKVTLDQLKE